MYCSISLLVVALTFVASQDPSPTPDASIVLPTQGSEWPPQITDRGVQAGIRDMRLQDVFRNPNNNPQSGSGRIRKPARGTYVIVVDPGCEGGISLTGLWSMSLRRTSDIPNSNSEILYFTQDGNDWYSNEAGFLYGFDSSDCRSRSFSARVVTNRDDRELVDAVFRADIVDLDNPDSTVGPGASGNGPEP